MSDKETSQSPARSHSRSASSRSRSREKSAPSANGSNYDSASPKHSRSRSRSRSKKRKHHSRSRSRHRHSRSRSRSHRRYSRSRSRSYDRRRSSRHDDDDRGSRRGHSRSSRSRSPMSHRRRHPGDRENPQTSRCLGIFGLSLYTQERDLREAFERFGPVDEVQVVYDHQTGRSRGFGFIYMRNYDDAVEAKEVAPGTEIDGRKIRVDFSITERAHTPTPGVYLGRPTAAGYRGGSRRSRSPGYGSKRRRSRSYSRSYSRSPRRY